jgi:16S rRNA (cytosine967-C5)-methyltransferase
MDVAGGEWLETALANRAFFLSQKDLALARALAYACLRHQSRLDFLVATKLSKRRNDQKVLVILRLGLAQILFFDRLGDHAIVYNMVRLAEIHVPGRQGLVNAILRDFLRDREAVWGWPQELDGREVDPLKRLSVFYSHPLWLVERLVAQLGYRSARGLLIANNLPASPTVRINPQRTSRAELAARLPFTTRETKYSPWGLIPEAWAGLPRAWPGYAEGHFAIQDEASQILGLLAKPAKTILDCCAGQGGKSLALAALYPTSRIVALDPCSSRLTLFREEVRRLGLGARLEIRESTVQTAKLKEKFGLVVVDAPCTGLGVIRRRPDVKWLKRLDAPRRMGVVQRELVKVAAASVAPGGQLIFSSCSIAEEEGPWVVERLLAEAKEFRALGREEIPPALRELMVGPGQLRLWPHLHGTDGFFYGVMTRGES